jgi:glycosyltransferase involved in cell wall biosynthesis
MTDLKLSILLPVRDEGINLRIMLKILQAVLEIPHEVLVICDSPEDSSIPVVKELQKDYPSHLQLVINDLGRGVVNAIRAGVAEAQGEFMLIFAADEVGPVLAISDMLSLAESGCDFVSCTRYAHGGRRLGGSLIGGILSRTANRLFHRLSGCVLSDATTGIKLFRRDIFDDLNLQANPVGWAVAFEMSIKAQMLGLRLGEVPIVSIDRLYGGTSTFRLGPWVKEYLRWFWWGIRNLRKADHLQNEAVHVRVPTPASLIGMGDRAPREK